MGIQDSNLSKKNPRPPAFDDWHRNHSEWKTFFGIRRKKNQAPICVYFLTGEWVKRNHPKGFLYPIYFNYILGQCQPELHLLTAVAIHSCLLHRSTVFLKCFLCNIDFCPGFRLHFWVAGKREQKIVYSLQKWRMVLCRGEMKKILGTKSTFHGVLCLPVCPRAWLSVCTVQVYVLERASSVFSCWEFAPQAINYLPGTWYMSLPTASLYLMYPSLWCSIVTERYNESLNK